MGSLAVLELCRGWGRPALLFFLRLVRFSEGVGVELESVVHHLWVSGTHFSKPAD